MDFCGNKPPMASKASTRILWCLIGVTAAHFLGSVLIWGGRISSPYCVGRDLASFFSWYELPCSLENLDLEGTEQFGTGSFAVNALAWGVVAVLLQESSLAMLRLALTPRREAPGFEVIAETKKRETERETGT